MENSQIKFKLKDVLSRELELRGMSLSKLAGLCNINKGTLHNWYNGSAPDARTIHHLVGLSEFLKISLVELLFDKKENKKNYHPVIDTTVLGAGGQYQISIKKLN
jgi:transcriptional regulator with XRE-family HTH domain